ncbi:hypothetical protein [Rahnella sp. ChDrAdgB13]|uniref:hypothetical protein n=1 Tax=Rahnella sp. ChDrAdgB13 TaxID=1850581 RepID=UPI001AD895E8|nr:hypothetical protein [Rahnella sp. ChDrAdgB13]
MANEYLFSPNSDTLLVKLNFGAYAIDDEGVIINRSDYYMDIVKFASLSSIDSLPTFFVLHDKNEINYQIALNSMDKVLKCCGTMFHGLSWGAIALKAKAVVLGDMGRVEDALQCCVDAIAIDPKVTAKQMRNNFCRQLKIEKDNIAPSEWVSDFKKSVEKIRADELIKIGENYKQLNARQEFLARKDQVKHEKSHLSSENKKAMLWVAALLIVIFIIWMSQ